ncbi:MAG: hypothetical protein M9886_11985 [Candidatus Nanopelagicales bacterium]|nr:hypothetical protein [Candidatus Nanopelagicales bacterium]
MVALPPLAFVIAGVVAALSVYSYAKLGSAYPSRGGAAVYFAGTRSGRALSQAA